MQRSMLIDQSGILDIFLVSADIYYSISLGSFVWFNEFKQSNMSCSESVFFVFTYALSFYRSQNVLCLSKQFGPHQKLNCILCCSKLFCASTKNEFTELKSSFGQEQKVNRYLVYHKKFGPAQNIW